MTLMTSRELANKALDVVKNYRTLYVMGGFGAPLNDRNKDTYCNHTSYNKDPKRAAKIRAASADTFAFDCSCLVKGLLWGWCGDVTKTYGGASYASNDVPDIGANRLIDRCSDISTNFKNIQVGEFLWMKDHCGIYIGDGLAVESTPIWKDGVQITAVGNIGKKSGYNTRTWTKHGKLPWIEYEEEAQSDVVIYNITIKKTLKQGDKGEEVKKLQMRVAQLSPELEKEVRAHSMNQKGEPDGIFGASMKSTIKKIQTAAGLSATGDVDAATLELLNANPVDLNRRIVGALNALE